MIHKKSILFLFAIAVICSCKKTEDITDFPTEPSRLVVNCLFNPDSVWDFQVSKSLSELDNSEALYYIDNATVKLFEDGNLLETLTSTINASGIIEYRSVTNKPIYGKTYSISVGASGFPTIEAGGQFPILKSTFETEHFIIADSTFDPITNIMDMRAKLSISINDPIGENNYYELYVIYFDTLYSVADTSITKKYATVTSSDPSIEGSDDNIGSVFFTDQLFNGQDHSISFNVSESFHLYTTEKFYIILREHSKESYLYKKSFSLFQQNTFDFFSEPVQVYNNIIDGYGIFGGYIALKDSVVLF